MSVNFGTTWIAGAHPTQGYFETVYGSPSGQYAVASDTYNEVYKTSNYGQSWTKITLPASGAYIYNAAISANGQVILAADDGSDNIYESFDGGQTWAADPNIPAVSTWWTLAGSADMSRVIAINSNGTLYTSYNPALVAAASTPPAVSTASKHESPALDDPDTGYGMPQNNLVIDAFFIVGATSCVCGFLLAGSRKKI